MSTYGAVLSGLRNIYSMLVSSDGEVENTGYNKTREVRDNGVYSTYNKDRESSEEYLRNTYSSSSTSNDSIGKKYKKESSIYKSLQRIADELGDKYLSSLVKFYPLQYVAEETLLSNNYLIILDKLFDNLSFTPRTKHNIQEIYSQLRRGKGMKSVWYYILKALDETEDTNMVSSFIDVLSDHSVLNVIETYQRVPGFDLVMFYIYYLSSEINSIGKEKIIKDISILADKELIDAINNYIPQESAEEFIGEIVKLAYDTRDTKKILSLAQDWKNRRAA